MSRGFVRKRARTWTWYLENVDPATGRRKQDSKGGFPTKVAALAALDEARRKRGDGAWAQPDKVTVKVFIEEHWLPTLTQRPTTVASYRAACRGWIVPRIGGLALTQVTPARVQRLYDDLRSSGRRDGGPLGDRSVAYAALVLRMALDHGVDQNFIARNPATKVKVAGAARPEMSAWTAEETERFLRAMADDRLYALWLLMLTRGPRRGEVCGLRWRDLDLDAGRMSIVRTRVLVDGRPVDSEPKTNAGRRRIPLDPVLVAALRAHRRRQLEERLAWGEAWTDTGQVFTAEDGTQLHPEWVSTAFETRVKRAGVRPIRLHDLRHTAATLAFAAGIRTEVVSIWLGHSTVSITQDIYQHIIPSMMEDAGAKLTAAVLGGNPSVVSEMSAQPRPTASHGRQGEPT